MIHAHAKVLVNNGADETCQSVQNIQTIRRIRSLEKETGGNKVRDRFVTQELRKMGWKVVRVWECELKSPEKVVAKLLHHLDKK